MCVCPAGKVIIQRVQIENDDGNDTGTVCTFRSIVVVRVRKGREKAFDCICFIGKNMLSVLYLKAFAMRFCGDGFYSVDKSAANVCEKYF